MRSGPAAASGYANRCGPSQRLPLLVISPYAKQNYVSHTATEQTSVLKFIEDNWSTGRIGDASFDKRAGTLTDMFDFAKPQERRVLLASNGSVSSIEPIADGGYGNGIGHGKGNDHGNSGGSHGIGWGHGGHGGAGCRSYAV